MALRLPKLACQRCGHRWVPRRTKVRMCPRCKSLLWNRTATGKEIKMPAQPDLAEDVLMCEVKFSSYSPPIRGWVVIRGGRQEFTEQDDVAALRRSRQLALKKGVRCFRIGVEGVVEPVEHQD